MKIGIRVDKVGDKIILRFPDPDAMDDLFPQYELDTFPCFVKVDIKKEWHEIGDA